MSDSETAAATDAPAIRKNFHHFPDHGYVWCFYCGEVFTTTGAAQDHFGSRQGDLAGCQIKVGSERGLLMHLRRTENELAEARRQLLDEDTDALRLLAKVQARHADGLRQAEEAGYERGLRAGQNMTAKPSEGAT